MAELGAHDILLKPPVLEKGRKLPLMVFLHGAGGSAHEMEKVVKPLVEAWNYFIFLPTGSVVKQTRHDTVLTRDWDPFADVAGVTEKIEELVRQHDIDPTSIFLSGFSSGATMAYVVGFERPDLFSGLVVFSGTLQKNLIDRGKFNAAKARLPICIVHGWFDNCVPWDRAGSAIRFLGAEGFRVRGFPYYGGHFFPGNWMDVLKEAMEWCHNVEEPDKRNSKQT